MMLLNGTEHSALNDTAVNFVILSFAINRI